MASQKHVNKSWYHYDGLRLTTCIHYIIQYSLPLFCDSRSQRYKIVEGEVRRRPFSLANCPSISLTFITKPESRSLPYGPLILTLRPIVIPSKYLAFSTSFMSFRHPINWHNIYFPSQHVAWSQLKAHFLGIYLEVESHNNSRLIARSSAWMVSFLLLIIILLT